MQGMKASFNLYSDRIRAKVSDRTYFSKFYSTFAELFPEIVEESGVLVRGATPMSSPQTK